MASGTSDYLSGIWGSSASDVFAVGGNGTVLHYDGSSWSPMTSGTSNAFNGVSGKLGQECLCCGGERRHHSLQRKQLEPHDQRRLQYAPWYLGKLCGRRLLVVGDYGTILHFEVLPNHVNWLFLLLLYE